MSVNEKLFHTFSAKGGPLGTRTEVALDGVPIKGCRGFELKSHVNDVSILKLELIVVSDIELVVPEEGISTDYSEPDGKHA